MYVGSYIPHNVKSGYIDSYIATRVMNASSYMHVTHARNNTHLDADVVL